MELKELRKIIRTYLQTQLKEAAAAPKKAPKNLSTFRSRLADALSQVGAPDDLVDEVNDVDLQGGEIFETIYSAWENIKAELQDLKASERDAEYPSLASSYVHDMVLDIVGAYSDSMNYEPGRRVPRLDAAGLATATVSAMFPVKKKTPDQMKARARKDLLDLVTDVLTQSGAAVGAPDYAAGTISYGSYDARKFPGEIKKSGLKAASGQVNTYVDDITGLTVTFGPSSATIQ